ncbi:glycosyltransferase family 61 protein [Psychrobacter sp. AOP7-D1-21]|uniref:glycosyltransferase family 61 protein n=1 Tax=Psychrobacter sp. AOP7-D1-21 TaxID=3457636 RepID=UPI00402B12EB
MTDVNTNNLIKQIESDNKFKKKLYAVNLPKFEKQVSKSYINNRKLQHKVIEKGVVLPLRNTGMPAVSAIYEGGVCDSDFNFVAGYKRIDNGKNNNYEIIRSYIPDEVNFIDEDIVFAGIAFAQFGHFLLESISRLWWIVKNKEFNKKVVFLKNKEFNAPFLELLELIGLTKDNIVFLDKPTKFRNVIVPDQSLCFFNYYHEDFLLPYNEIMNKIVPYQQEKIYLSRTQFSKKDVINEEYFEDFYREMGYKIIYPEKLTIKEQISYISGASEIVSTVGSISHLAIFAKPKAKIVSLFRARNFLSIAQVMINQAKELDYTFVDPTCNFLPSRHSAACSYIGPNATWINFIKEEYGIDSNIDILTYLNSEKSYMGTYFKQWINTFGNTKQIKKIKNDNSLDILGSLEVIFSERTDNFKPITEKLAKKLTTSSKNSSLFVGKTFNFSRYDGTRTRQIHLLEDGKIETVSGKGHKNESFWNIVNDELIFLDILGKVTSRYFCIKEKNNGLFLLGYYEPNKEIIFKLDEVSFSSLRTVKKTKI